MFATKLPSRNLSLLVGIFLTGCASTFEPRLAAHDLGKSGLADAKEVSAGVEISVEEYASSHKSLRAFDADVASRGVLPLLLRIENNTAANLIVQRKQIMALTNEQPLAPLHGFEAAEQGAMRNGVWNALVNTAALGPLAIYFWPLTMAGSASQTQKINRQVERHFESLELTDTVLKPGDKLAGFVFYRIPSDGRPAPMTVTVALGQEIAGESAPHPLLFKLALPPFAPTTAEGSNRTAASHE